MWYCVCLCCLVFVMSCLVFVLYLLVLCCVVLCCVMLCCVVFVFVFVLSCLVLSCLVLSCLVLSCLVLSCLVLSRLILSYHVSSCSFGWGREHKIHLNPNAVSYYPYSKPIPPLVFYLLIIHGSLFLISYCVLYCRSFTGPSFLVSY